jgi:hypothetical protein
MTGQMAACLGRSTLRSNFQGVDQVIVNASLVVSQGVWVGLQTSWHCEKREDTIICYPRHDVHGAPELLRHFARWCFLPQVVDHRAHGVEDPAPVCESEVSDFGE